MAELQGARQPEPVGTEEGVEKGEAEL